MVVITLRFPKRSTFRAICGRKRSTEAVLQSALSLNLLAFSKDSTSFHCLFSLLPSKEFQADRLLSEFCQPSTCPVTAEKSSHVLELQFPSL